MYILDDEVNRKGMWSRPEEIGLERLYKLISELLKNIDGILGIKLTGSVADGNFFLLQFKDIYIASDYDVLIVLNRYPTHDELSKIKEILSREVFGTDIEKILLENMDIKVVTTEYPYKGRGVKIPTVYDQDISVARHLYGGITIYGEKFFKGLNQPSEWLKRQIVHRIIKRKRIFDIFTELGAYDRVAAALGRDDLRIKISKIVSRYRDYHSLSSEDIEQLNMELSRLKNEISVYM